MKLFRCTCRTAPILYFENVSCGACGRLTGFSPDALALGAYVPAGPGLWRDEEGRTHRLCGNRERHGVCNWMVPCPDAREAGSAEGTAPAGGVPSSLCRACRLNRVIPDLSVGGNLALWRALEQAKRRCLFTFLELGMPFDDTDPRTHPLAFRFMADGAVNPPGTPGASDGGPVTTGHLDGLVTINLAEADAIARTRMQLAMQERYRTLLGHFRHETGHYFWNWFARTDPGFLARFRTRFGDERSDYGAAVIRHYDIGAPLDWRHGYISAYATMHPWEDWAESWAHYLHIVDTLETWQSVGQETRLDTAVVRDIRLPFRMGTVDAASPGDFDAIVTLWIEASVMLNGLNRSMGLPDPYPFVLNQPAREKLRFVHEAVIAAGHPHPERQRKIDP